MSSIFTFRRAPALQSRRLQHRSRRRGVAFVYTALGLAVALMMAAVVIDIGMLYQRKAAMQSAADPAALAGAYTLANFGEPYDAYLKAGEMAARPENGGYTAIAPIPGNTSKNYVAQLGGTKFDTVYPAYDETGAQRNNWFQVTLSRPQSSIFGGMWPLNIGSYGVSVTATALYETLAPLEIKGTGTYGVAPGPVNLSLFGPAGRYSYGDAYSTEFLDDGRTRNPKYNSKGYDFRVSVPRNQGSSTLDIFDPDCYNANGAINASATAIDELRTRNGNGTIKDATTTRYSLYFDNNTAKTSDDVLIGSREWGADGADSDMKWVEAFEFNRQAYGNGNFRLNVKSTAGSSENGFDLRVGPKREETTTTETERYITGYRRYKGYASQRTTFTLADGSKVTVPRGSNYDFYDSSDPIFATRDKTVTTPAPPWDPNNGTAIQAIGHLPINFNVDGTIRMKLGKVPPKAGGADLIIRKFDTDVKAQSIIYTCDLLPGQSWKGTLSTDGTFATDRIRIPKSYRDLTTAGTWYAEYVAGNQDTSVWDMSYNGVGDGSPGSIKLVR